MGECKLLEGPAAASAQLLLALAAIAALLAKRYGVLFAEVFELSLKVATKEVT